MKFINFAIVRFSLFLVLGILTARFYPVSHISLSWLAILFSCVLALWFWARNQLVQTAHFGIATYLCFFAIGHFSYQMRLPQFQKKHFSHVSTGNAPQILQLKIVKTFKPDKFNLKYLATVDAVQGKPTTGKILLSISKDSINPALPADKVLLVYGTIAKIEKQLNPHQFEYSTYMESIGVYRQVRISHKDILKIQDGSATITGFAQNLRAGIVEKLQKTSLKTDERAIIQALVLGEKNDIDKELYSDYAAAGAVHILAVSGLHVGILYVILSFVLRPLGFGKNGTIIKSILIVLLLWSFALLSGLSPSVSRAVAMFSFFAFAKLLDRQTSSINTLFLSFFVLLIINPLWLFHVGFQLSYLAVFFIVWLLPLFRNIIYSKNWFVRKIGGIGVVSLCAQIGVLPLSLYYFHQFPGLFLLTNMVILPLLTILMFGAILIVILAIIEILPEWLAIGYNFLMETMNGFIHWIAVQEDFLFQNIHFSVLKVLGAYLLIITLVLFFKKMTYRRMSISLTAISLFISIYIFDSFRNSQNQFIVFHQNRKSLIGYKNGRNLTVFSNDTIKNISQTYPVKSYKIGTNTTNYGEKPLRQLFRYKNKNILVMDSLGIMPKKRNIHTLLLTNSPKINLNRIIDSLRPKQIIADGSNYPSYVARWKRTCQSRKLLFSHTGEQGAIVIE